MRATRAAPVMAHPRGPDAGAVLQAAALNLMGRDDLAARELGEAAAQAGRDLRIRTALDLAEYTMRAAGLTPPRNKFDLARDAFNTFDLRAGPGGATSTYSLPVLLGNTANTMLLSAYRESPQTWRAFADVKSASNFHTQTGVRPSGMQSMALLPRSGEIKHGTITEATYPWSIDTYARLLAIDRRDIVNDSLGAFAENSVAFGRAAARSVNDKAYTVFLDNSAFFSAGNNNVLTGAGSALSATSLGTALSQLAKQTDPSGNVIDIRGMFLVVPPELEQTAKALLQSDFIQLASTSTGPTGNSLRNALQLVVEPRLSNASYTGNSATAWYLTGAPSDGVLIVGFLDGRENPVVEFFGFDTNPERLTATWRAYHDYGAALGDYRAGQRAAGA
jgi:hypothetical protein